LLTTQYLEEADFLADRIMVIDKGTVIAEGTAKELKDQIGTGVLEIHLADQSKAGRVVELLKQISTTEPVIDEVTNSITIPSAEGSKTLLEAVRLLDSEQIAVVDIELRKPTLDEVFLSLTGRGKE
jgi:ABC-2 type transport system ATP-binding protein